MSDKLKEIREKFKKDEYGFYINALITLNAGHRYKQVIL